MHPRPGPRRRTHLDDQPDFDFDRDLSPDPYDPDAERAEELSRKDMRTLARNFRSIIPVRAIGGSCIMSLPKGLRLPLDIKTGDRLLVELDPIKQAIVITKDSDGNRQRALKEVANIKEIWKSYLHLKQTRDFRDPVWGQRAEKLLGSLVKHLKGEILEKAEDDEGEDL